MNARLHVMTIGLLLAACSSSTTTRSKPMEQIFPPEPIPRPTVIVEPFEGDSDRAALAAALAAKKWTSITYKYLRRAYPGPPSEAFAYLTPIGQAYFLPAFLRMIS